MGTDALWFRGFGFPNCLEMFENEKSFHLMHFKLNLINVSVSTTSFDFKANRKFLNYPKLILSEHFKTKRIFVRFFIKKFCILENLYRISKIFGQNINLSIAYKG